MKTAIICVVGLVLAACAGNRNGGSAGGTDGESQRAVADAPAQQSSADPQDAGGELNLTGTWSSASCGERRYQRKISFGATGKFQAQDLVSPCPPGAQCVWSGIVRFTGTFTWDEYLVHLAVDPVEGSPPQMAKFPDQLVILQRDPPAIGERAGDMVCPLAKE